MNQRKYTKFCHFGHKEDSRLVKVLQAFLERCDAPGWYRGSSATQIQAGLRLAIAIHTDTELRTTHRVHQCLYTIGLSPVVRGKSIRDLLRICGGSDLAFLWFLWEMHYKTPGADYTFNEQIILSCIYNLDIMFTIKELHRILPPPQLPKRELEKQRLLKEKKAKAEAIAAKAESRKNRPKRPLKKLEPYFQTLVLRKKIIKNTVLTRPYSKAKLDILSLYREYGGKLRPLYRWDSNLASDTHAPGWDILMSVEKDGNGVDEQRQDIQNAFFEKMVHKEIDRILRKIPGDRSNFVLGSALCTHHKNIQDLEQSLQDELKVIAQQRCRDYLAVDEFQTKQRRDRILTQLEKDIKMYSEAFKKLTKEAREQCPVRVVPSDTACEKRFKDEAAKLNGAECIAAKENGATHLTAKEKQVTHLTCIGKELQRNRCVRFSLQDSTDVGKESKEREEHAKCFLAPRIRGGHCDGEGNTTKCGDICKKRCHQREPQGDNATLGQTSGILNLTSPLEKRFSNPRLKNEGGGDACYCCHGIPVKSPATKKFSKSYDCCGYIGDMCEPPSMAELNELRAKVSACPSTTKDLLGATLEPSEEILHELRARVNSAQQLQISAYAGHNAPHSRSINRLVGGEAGTKNSDCYHRHSVSSPNLPAELSELRAKVNACRSNTICILNPSEQTMKELRARVDAAWKLQMGDMQHRPSAHNSQHQNQRSAKVCCRHGHTVDVLKDVNNPKRCRESAENLIAWGNWESFKIKKTEPCSPSAHVILRKLRLELDRKVGNMHQKEDEDAAFQPTSPADKSPHGEERMSWEAVRKEYSGVNLDSSEPCPSNAFFQAPTAHSPYKFQYEKLLAEPQTYSSEHHDVKREIVAALDDEFSGDKHKQEVPDINEAVRKCVQRTWEKLIAEHEAKVNCKDQPTQHKHEANPIRLKYSQDYIDPDDTALMNAMLKDALQHMSKNPKFVLAALPDADKLPFLRSWIYGRYGRVYDTEIFDQERQELIKICRVLKKAAKRCVSLGTDYKVDDSCVSYLNFKSKHIEHQAFRETDKYFMDHVRVLWLAMIAFFSLGVAPRDLFFAYMPSRLSDIIRFGYWKRSPFDAWKERALRKKRNAPRPGRTVKLQP